MHKNVKYKKNIKRQLVYINIIIMYNTDYNCTYNSFLDTYQGTDEEKEYVTDILYKTDLLSILNIEEFEEENINNAIEQIYEQIKDNVDLKICMLKLANDFMSSDEIFGLILLFSFDYLIYTHICISEFLKTKNISKENLKMLRDAIY
jgi:hypothetical protein